VSSKLSQKKEIEGATWDAIVVGSGMGGSACAFRLARAGKKVLILESGSKKPTKELLGQYPTSKYQGWLNNKKKVFNIPQSLSAGGLSQYYGSHLERFKASDFRSEIYAGGASNSEMFSKWPLSYECFAQYYRKAEHYLTVRGTPSVLYPDNFKSAGKLFALDEASQNVWNVFELAGLKPYRSHIGFQRDNDCAGCGSVICPKKCKVDAVEAFLKPALGAGAKLLTDVTIEKIHTKKKGFYNLLCQRGDEDVKLNISAKALVLAAGALGSPKLYLTALQSAQKNENAGRYLMFHFSDFLGLKVKGSRKEASQNRILTTDSLYEKSGGGLIQSATLSFDVVFFRRQLTAIVNKNSVIGLLFRPVAIELASKFLFTIFKNFYIFGTIFKDPPRRDNRLYIENGLWMINYNYSSEVLQQQRVLRELLKSKLSPFATMFFLNKVANLNFGHACGTMRSGLSPTNSVVDAHFRLHEYDNIFVADASVFPTSGGVNPSLTVATVGLIVADQILSNGNQK